MSTATELSNQIVAAYNNKDVDALEKLIHENLDFAHFNRGGGISTRAEALGIMKAVAPLIPDRCYQPPERVTESGDTVVREAYWGGTPVADIPGLGKEGEKIHDKLCSVMRFDNDGLLVEWKDYG